MAFWQITYGGVTKDAAIWGIYGLKRKRRAPVDTDVVMFSLPAAPFDTRPLPFAYLQPLIILRNGVRWFEGVVTKPMPKGSGKRESIDYEISGPWYWLEKTVFQQQWTQITAGEGGGLVTSTTTQSETILGQSLDGIKMNSGQVMLEVLIYAQYAYQMIPFPAVVDVNHLPPAPSAHAPFIIGTITPSITVPYMSVRDKSCADILRQMMKYSPDAVAWFDYSTSPPTLNIGQRGGLTKKSITLFPAPGSSTPKLATSFNPTPRYDLQIPVVVAKFLEKNDINGTSYAQTTVQVYPPAPPNVNPEAWASQSRAWVQTIDLVGGHTTVQTAEIKSIPRPILWSDPIAQNWALSKLPNISATNPNGTFSYNGRPVLYDCANMVVNRIATTINPSDPLTDPNKNPNNITIGGNNPPGDCPQLVFELLTGQFPPWMQDDPNNLDAAKVMVQVYLGYTGSDPATMKLFWQDPNDPNAILTSGGMYIFYYPCKVTNAATNTYSELTSWQGGEPVPVGFAQSLYESLAPLHFQGELTMVETECSDQLPVGCVFNTTDGNPDWQTANMLVLSVDEDIDRGTTQVQFGPPAFLSLEEMEQLFRANLGIFPAYKLGQRTSGMLTAGSNVIGAEHAADTHLVQPQSPPTTAQIGPFTITYGPKPNTPGVYQVRVDLTGIFLNVDGSAITLTNFGTYFNLDGNDTLWLEAPTPSVTVSSVAIKSYGNGDNGLTHPNSYWVAGGLVENDGGVPSSQTVFRKVLATFVASSTGAPVLTTRQTTTNLQIFTVPIIGMSALYPYPI